MHKLLFRSIVLSATFFLLFIASAFAQEHTLPNAKSCLWKVQSQANTVYLLGSIHLLKPENYPLPAEMEQAFAEAQVLVFEIDPDSLALPSVQQFVLGKGMFGGGKTLQSSLEPETYALAQKRAAELGLNLILLQSFEPWLVSLTLTGAKLQQMGLAPQNGVDQYFFKKAKAERKTILTLESIAFQVSRFDNLSLKNQNALLLETLKEWEVLEKDLNTMVQAWSHGEADTLAAKLFEGFKAYPEVYAAVITERNRNWLPRIEKFLAADKIHLVIVGAGHMVGNEGLIKMLSDKGFVVEQL
jgi:uncharacterized protein YbaP (TraB family)